MNFILSFIFSFLFLIGVSQNKTEIIIDREQTNDGVILYVTNNESCPVSTAFNFDLENLKSSFDEEQILVIPEKAQRFKIAELKAIDRRKGWRFSYDYQANLGDINVSEYDADHVYELPYNKGNSFIINQGYNGSTSHKNENAFDFNMPEGTEILAARGGLVVKVVQDNTQAGFKEEYKKYNNYIIIYHSDGTFASYAHIQFNGARVKEGDVVNPGDLIALSGNVGYTTGPHLHFACYLPGMDKPQTLATKFKTGTGQNAEYLQEKESYYKNY